jgi:hypothetical protein
MVKFKNITIWILVLFLGCCFQAPASGQDRADEEFFLMSYKSLSPIERFGVSRIDIFKTFLTFHPLSVSGDTVNLYVSSVFTDEEGNQEVELGRIISLPTSVLPGENLQLLVLPLVVYLNNDKALQNDFKFYDRFTRDELKAWKDCGYTVAKPTQIATSVQYR